MSQSCFDRQVKLLSNMFVFRGRAHQKIGFSVDIGSELYRDYRRKDGDEVQIGQIAWHVITHNVHANRDDDVSERCGDAESELSEPTPLRCGFSSNAVLAASSGWSSQISGFV